jgi:hypothetical protein
MTIDNNDFFVRNGLKKNMMFIFRFKVTREDVKKDASTSIDHMHYIDVPASGSKDFKLSMYFYKEGTTQMKVNKCLKRCIHELSPILRIIYKCFK